jgi:hypothetical protein
MHDRVSIFFEFLVNLQYILLILHFTIHARFWSAVTAVYLYVCSGVTVV